MMAAAAVKGEEEEKEYIRDKQVVSCKRVSRNSHESPPSETHIVSLQNLRSFKANGSGMDDLKSYRENQICSEQQLNRTSLENEKMKIETKNSLKREISDQQQQQQHWLSNQLEMIAAESRPVLVEETTSTTINNDNDHSFELCESFGIGNQTKSPRRGEKEGVVCREEICHEITASSKIRAQAKTASSKINKQQAEWNLMQIVESAESKLMRQKQARDEEARMLKLRQATEQSSSFRQGDGNGDIIQIENESKSKIQSQTKNHAADENTSPRPPSSLSSCCNSETTTFLLPNTSFPLKISRRGLMLKSPAFSAITLEKASEDEGGDCDREQPFALEPSAAAGHERTAVVSDCGRKFGPTGCKVGPTLPHADEGRVSGSSGYVTAAGNMTNRVENEAPSQCRSWVATTGKEESVRLECSLSSNVVGSEKLPQTKSLSVFVSPTSKIDTPTSSYKPFLLRRNSPLNFGGRDEGTKQHHQQSLTTSATTKDHGRCLTGQNTQPMAGDCREEEENEDREGPTPTNDLIRALIQRDKVALSGKWYQEQQQQQESSSGSQAKVVPKNPVERPVAIDSSPSWSASSSSSSPFNNNTKTGSSSPLSSSPSPIPHSQKRRHKLEQQLKQHHSRATIGLGARQANKQQGIEQVVVVAGPNRRKRKRAKQQMRAIRGAVKSKLPSIHTEQQQRAKEVLDCLTKTPKHPTTTRKSVIRTETVEPNLTSSVDYHVNNSTSKRIGFGQKESPVNSNSEQEISQIDTTTTAPTSSSSFASNANTRQLATKMLDTQSRDKQRPNWDSFAARALELSAQLTSKCHFVASGRSDGGGGGVESANRKPSDASSHSEYNVNETSDNNAQQPRRHSTYMLPMLLNRDPNDNTLSSSSTSSSSSVSPSEQQQRQRQLSETGIAGSLSDLLAEEELARVLTGEPGSVLVSSSRNLTNQGLASHLSNRQTNYLSQNPKLTTSASSPSALSTPTNDKTGCGGPCCSQPTAAETFDRTNLVGAAREGRDGNKHSIANDQANVMKRIRKLSLFSGNHHGLITSNTHSNSRSKTKNSELKQQQQQQQPRQRTGSNPLERLRFTTNHLSNNGEHHPERGSSIMKLSSPRARIQSIGATNELAKLSLKSGKRHSIINLLAGNGCNNNNSSNVPSSNHFASKLNPRSIFSTSLHHRDGIKSNNNNLAESSLTENSMNKTSITSSNWVENHLPFTSSSNKLHLIEQQQQQDQQCEPLIPESGFKIVVMGTSGSGKTSIIQRFMYNSFNWRHLPTVEDTYFIEFPYKKNLINISISDTSGKYFRPSELLC